MGTNLTQLKDNLSKKSWLVFIIFLMYNFEVSLAELYYFVTQQRNDLTFFLLKLVFTCVFDLYFQLFSQSKRMEILLYSVSFCPLNLTLLHIQLLRLLSHGKEKLLFIVFLSVLHINSSSFC